MTQLPDNWKILISEFGNETIIQAAHAFHHDHCNLLLNKMETIYDLCLLFSRTKSLPGMRMFSHSEFLTIFTHSLSDLL